MLTLRLIVDSRGEWGRVENEWDLRDGELWYEVGNRTTRGGGA